MEIRIYETYKSTILIYFIAFNEVLLMFLNTMFHAPMGRFQLEPKLELPLFSGFTVVELCEWDDGET